MTKPDVYSLASSPLMRSLASSGEARQEESITSSKSQGCLDIRSGLSRRALHQQASEFLAENKNTKTIQPNGKRRRKRNRPRPGKRNRNRALKAFIDEMSS